MLSDQEGAIAVRFAREIGESAVKTGSYKVPQIELPPVFEQNAGAFVTVLSYPTKELRGCIGIPEPVYTLRLALLNAAVESVLSDPRFEPVREEELQSTIFEVTVLQPPRLLQVKSQWELPRQIKVGIHGLIAERGRFKGLLLPQVAVEEGWDSEEFLNKTCWKAGLPEDAWQDPRVRIYTFEGEVFSETSPRGEVRRRELGQ
ncbi:MAG: TIGR00296 family protein [Methanomassiliicoccales archaeon]